MYIRKRKAKNKQFKKRGLLKLPQRSSHPEISTVPTDPGDRNEGNAYNQVVSGRTDRHVSKMLQENIREVEVLRRYLYQ